MLLISTFIFVNAITVNSIVCKNFEDIVYFIFSLIVFTVINKSDDDDDDGFLVQV